MEAFHFYVHKSLLVIFVFEANSIFSRVCDFFRKKYGVLCLENKKNSSCGLKFDVLRCLFVQKG